jgi:hypothetical protein
MASPASLRAVWPRQDDRPDGLRQQHRVGHAGPADGDHQRAAVLLYEPRGKPRSQQASALIADPQPIPYMKKRPFGRFEVVQ